ncbi:MAG: sterol desaturase family protein [Gammaproteobacteria bacterium]
MINETLTFITMAAPHSDWLPLPAVDPMSAIFFLTFITLFSLEINLARHERTQSALLLSYRTNVMTILFNDVLLSLLSVSSLLLVAERYNGQGLFHALGFPAKLAISLILLDLTLYLWHRANHNFDWLWRFHKVHHSDRSMNVTTAFRLHIVEVLLTTALKMLFIVVFGIEAAVVAICETVTALFALFHHANISLPGEKWLGRLIIVPSLHRVHHSALRQEHDNNYGAILSLWDRLFRTMRESLPVEIGIKNVEAQNFVELVKFGFAPAISHATETRVQPANLYAMISEAAYYKAQMRGFAPGRELLDWLDAEKEIYSRFNRTQLHPST